MRSRGGLSLATSSRPGSRSVTTGSTSSWKGSGAVSRLSLMAIAYHSPDRVDDDQRRQMSLERLGWIFNRIRGSAYYRDPDSALSGLWDRLESLGASLYRLTTAKSELSSAPSSLSGLWLSWLFRRFLSTLAGLPTAYRRRS
jgi:hypothetical protein